MICSEIDGNNASSQPNVRNLFGCLKSRVLYACERAQDISLIDFNGFHLGKRREKKHTNYKQFAVFRVLCHLFSLSLAHAPFIVMRTTILESFPELQ